MQAFDDIYDTIISKSVLPFCPACDLLLSYNFLIPVINKKCCLHMILLLNYRCNINDSELLKSMLAICPH